MTLVYNSLSSDSHKGSKLSVLRNLIRFAAEARLMELVLPFLASAASWPVKWGLSPAQAGSLYLQLAQSMERCGALEESQAYLIRYLATLETASEADIAAATPHAVQAALNFVKAPAISQKSNLSRLAAVSDAVCCVCVCVCVWRACACAGAWDELSVDLTTAASAHRVLGRGERAAQRAPGGCGLCARPCAAAAASCLLLRAAAAVPLPRACPLLCRCWPVAP